MSFIRGRECHLLRLRRQLLVVWAAILLLFCGHGGALEGGEAEQLSPPDEAAAESDPFRSEELTVAVGDHQLAGTLYLPTSSTSAPAVVFVHGAGPAVRSDGYQELGHHFARKGIAALIYDKRGCGESTGDWTRAGLYDLAEDALACVRVLRARSDINPDQIGLWGLSQGASIIPIAAGRSPEVAFLIAVGGCLNFEDQMCYFRANLFRRLHYPLATLDIANKVFLIQTDLSSRIRSGSLPAPAAWRDACRFEFDLDQAAVWRQVRQPVLAIYGERDRQVPVAENITALTKAIAEADNRDFTLIIYPGGSHSIGKTQTGELREKWTGYIPEYLDDMCDWVLQQANGTKRPEGWPKRAQVPEFDHPFPPGHYDRLRWYGNAPVQVGQFIVFTLVFLITAVVGTISTLRGWQRGKTPTVTGSAKWLTSIVTATCFLNLAMLVGLVVLTRGLTNPWEPAYPAVLNWLPLTGSLSVCLTLTLLALMLTHGRTLSVTRRTRIGWVLLASCTIAFVPFLFYWNLVGLVWH